MLTPATPITSALCNLLAWAEEANSRLPPPATVADKRGKYGCNPYTIPAMNAAREALASLIQPAGLVALGSGRFLLPTGEPVHADAALSYSLDAAY
jgi:hypothetical protein